MQLPLGTGTVDVSLPECSVRAVERPGGETVGPARAALNSPHGPAPESLATPATT